MTPISTQMLVPSLIYNKLKAVVSYRPLKERRKCYRQPFLWDDIVIRRVSSLHQL